MRLNNKDLLGIRELSADEIKLILDTADKMKLVLEANSKKTAHLQGKSVVTLFYENSTRTRLSFEMASKFMGASSANISASGSSVNKGESLIDTAKTIDSMSTDIIIMRHQQSGAPHMIAPYVKASIVNAGDGMNEHPTQALLDMMTMRHHLGDLKDKKIVIVGDLLHSRVARSNLWGLTKLGAKVFLAGPSTMTPRCLDQTPAVWCSNINDAVVDADVVMGLRVQLERQQKALFPSVNEYARFYAISQETLALASQNAILMHPGPCNHGVEMPSSVYNSSQSVINEQVTNGVAVRMAVLFLLASRRNL